MMVVSQNIFPPCLHLSPFLRLTNSYEGSPVLGVGSELIPGLDHVLAEVLVVGQLLPLEPELLGGDIVVQQQLCSHG